MDTRSLEPPNDIGKKSTPLWKPLSFAEIGKVLGVTYQRAQQIHNQMIHKLQNHLLEDPLIRDWLIENDYDFERLYREKIRRGHVHVGRDVVARPRDSKRPPGTRSDR
tara:strand:- start:3306 stop:3629 length:324 start_codon:yes stop_codon:yes gene_type:complete